MWIITDDQNRKITIEALQARYPDLVAYDESGFEVEPSDLDDDAETLADNGYGARDTRRILFWESEEDSQDDDGAGRAVASATWIDR